MSLHKYFKSNDGNRKQLDAIATAGVIAELTTLEREKVATAIRNIGSKGKEKAKKKTTTYEKYDGHKRIEVAKFALKSGLRPAARKFNIAFSTVQGFVASYKEAKATSEKELTSLPHRRRGARTLLPEEIDRKVMEMTASMRLAGAVVNYNVIIAVAKGIVMANDSTLLAENGGGISLGWRWCESIFRRMNWTKRKGTTTKPTIPFGLIKEVGLTFFKDIAETVQKNNIPPELIINIDQTPLPFILISKYTMNKKGAKNVPIQGTDDYRQITGTFAVAMSGEFLPMQLIYEGKTPRCLPKYTFPSDFHVTQNPTHWANETTSLELLEKIILPYVFRTREKLGVPESQKWLLICDVFKAQWTDPVKDMVRESSGCMVAVPHNWTSYFQPLDISVNKPCKDFLRNEAQTWYSKRIVEQLKTGKSEHEVKVDTKISIVKPLHANWVTKFYDHIRNNPEMVRNGWKRSKITEFMHQKIEMDPFVSSL